MPKTYVNPAKCPRVSGVTVKILPEFDATCEKGKKGTI
jgi:hypothetical protein